MGKGSKRFNQRKQQLQGLSSAIVKKKIQEAVRDNCLCFSFRHMDISQSETFEDWQAAGLLVKLNERMRNLSEKRMSELFAKGDKEFKPYENAWSKQHLKITQFGIPQALSAYEEMHWVSFSVQGKPRVIGHLIENVFYVVFLDKEHKFWPSKKKGT